MAPFLCWGHFMKKKKVAFKIILGLCLLFLYGMIFSFSEQTGEESGSLSFYISRLGAEILNQITKGKRTDAMLDGMAAYWENPIRKCAHFAEYALMGFLICGILHDVIKSRKKYAVMLLWVFLSAAADELHQFFVPGRCGNIADVLLDTCGGGFGILLFCGILFVVNRISFRR